MQCEDQLPTHYLKPISPSSQQLDHLVEFPLNQMIRNSLENSKIDEKLKFAVTWRVQEQINMRHRQHHFEALK